MPFLEANPHGSVGRGHDILKHSFPRCAIEYVPSIGPPGDAPMRMLTIGGRDETIQMLSGFLRRARSRGPRYPDSWWTVKFCSKE